MGAAFAATRVDAGEVGAGGGTDCSCAIETALSLNASVAFISTRPLMSCFVCSCSRENSESSVPMWLWYAAMAFTKLSNLSTLVCNEVWIAGLLLIEVPGGGEEAAGHPS